MGTYSKYTGTFYETTSSSLLLSDSSTQSYTLTNNNVYTDLFDNTDKLIDPNNLRNAILSIYDTIPFKETITGNSTYIGIDNGDPNNRDLKNKIYLGKRNYLDNEIMNTTLLSSDTDIFINNTKSDTSSQNKTNISFLSGTNNSLNENAPFIQSEVAYDKLNNNLLSFNIINRIGDINIKSKGPNVNDYGGTVSVNNVVFPSIQDSDPSLGGSCSNSRVLIYNNGSMVWSDLTLTDEGYYGSTGSTLPIYGDPTYINGYELEFNDDRNCPISISDIKLGDTFSSSIVNVLERLIYEYIKPNCSLSLYNTNEYYEVGTSPIIQLNYSISKKSNNTLPTSLNNMIPNYYPSIVSDTNQDVSGIANGILITPIENDTTVFTITVSDGVSSNSASSSVSGVYPYFYGFTSSSSISTYGLGNLDKFINKKDSNSYDIYKPSINQTDYFYFIYDFDYGYLTSIYDYDNNNITGSFSNSVVTLSSPSGLWASKKFIVYKSSVIANDYLVNYAYPNNEGTLILDFNF